ncbi:MAG: ketoacyl-ACP synthase III [Bdellovibrionales bacterium]|nr:ketoacyl-ACP synthase III [Bdellovibrionales bacterium]
MLSDKSKIHAHTPEHVSHRGNCGIIGTGSALPRRRISNEEIAQAVETSDEWIRERVGIASRHIADKDESAVSLAYEASLRAMEMAGVTAGEVDLLVFGTVSPDQPLPSAAALLQRKLGIPGAMSFDVRAACSGFVFALAAADGLLGAHGFSTALVVGAETLSRIVDWSDRNTCVLFGDGAGAVVYRGSGIRGTNGDAEQVGILASDLHTTATQADFIRREGGSYPPATLPQCWGLEAPEAPNPYVQMSGREVFKSAVVAMVSSMRAVLDRAGVSMADVDHFVPHQSNRRIVEAVCERMGMPATDPRVIMNIDSVGNTSAASIPIALDEAARTRPIRPGDLVLLSAVGAGISYGSMLIRW